MKGGPAAAGGLVLALTVGLAPGGALAGEPNRAGLFVSGHVGMALPQQHPGHNAVLSPSFRLGYQLAFGLAPEIRLAFSNWCYEDYEISQLTVEPGIRFRFSAGLIQPWIAAHAGWGRTRERGFPGDSETRRGLAIDAGGGLDVAVLRHLLVGLHLEYNAGFLDVRISGSRQAITWVDFGGGVTVLF